MTAPTTSSRCEPKDPTQGRLHWVQNITGYHEPITARWSQFDGGAWFIGGAWLNGRQAYSMGWRYIAPVTPPAEVEALRNDAIASCWAMEAALVAADESVTLRAEITTLRARVAAMEAALLGIVREQQSEAQAGTGEYQRGYDDCIAAHADLARAALETKP